MVIQMAKQMPQVAGPRVRHEISQHKDILIRAERDGSLAADSRSATVSNVQWFYHFGDRGPLPTEARMAAQQRILEEYWQMVEDVPLGRNAIVMAGPPGAGKSTTEARIRAELAPGEAWRKIDPDEFKDLLLRRAYMTGEYDQIVPPDLHENKERAYLRELAALVHEESGILAARARMEAVERGENIVIDGTQKTYSKTRRLIDHLLHSLYSISLVDVEVRFATSRSRVTERWARGYLQAEDTYLQGGSLVDHLGGRWVPLHCIEGIFQEGATKPSICQEVVARIASEFPGIRVRIEPNEWD